MDAPPTTLDVVVHFHGYSRFAESMQIDRHKEPYCGLDFVPPASEDDARGRTRPTLALLPRGHWVGGRRYRFPALVTPGAIDALIADGLERFAQAANIARPSRGRVILTAHSGGGAALLRSVADVDPDEVHIFDGLYQSAGALARWARERIADGRSGSSALRVLYRPHGGTEQHSVALRRAIAKYGGGADVVARRFRVEATRVDHSEMPRRFGWRLLADAAADLPDVGTE
jgi:hypothetical protein